VKLSIEWQLYTVVSHYFHYLRQSVPSVGNMSMLFDSNGTLSISTAMFNRSVVVFKYVTCIDHFVMHSVSVPSSLQRLNDVLLNVCTTAADRHDWLCVALENVQSELFDMKTKYDEATTAKYVMQIFCYLSGSKSAAEMIVVITIIVVINNNNNN